MSAVQGELMIRVGASPDHYQELWCCGQKAPVGSHVRILEDDQKWQRFALLYNIEGQKYTIGQRFEDRETQGEYLFCYCDRVSKASHCQITCEGGRFFVENLQGRTGPGTFINEEKVVGKVELKFGDILALGVRGNVNPTQVETRKKTKKKEERTAVLWFQEPLLLESMYTYSELNKSSHKEGCFSGQFVNMVMGKEKKATKAKKAERNNGQQGALKNKSEMDNDEMCDFSPGRNSLVLSEILKHLPLDDVKACRLVCSEWHAEATKLLMKNSVVSLDFSQGYIPPIARNRLFSFVYEMGTVISQGKISLDLPCCSDFGPDVKKGGPTEKLVSDMNWFFGGGFAPPVTMLDISGSVRCRKEFELWSSILEKSGKNITELSLSLELDLSQESPYPKPVPVTFPALKRLTLKPQAVDKIFTQQGNDFVEVDNSQKMKEWIVSLVNSSPALQSLSLDSSDLYSAFSCLVLEQVIQGGFPLLNAIKLSDYPDATLKLLLKLPRRLSKLTLNCNGYDEDTVKDLKLLEGVIAKFAPTLEYLKITVPEVDSERQELWKDKGVHLPASFPKLRIFKVNGAPGDAVIDLIFPDGCGINYEKHFPNLKCLSVDPFENPSATGNIGSRQFFEIFFPVETEQICNTVQALDIPYLRDNGCVGDYVYRIASMFPQAKNKHLEDVRAQEAQSSTKRRGRKRKASSAPSTRTLRPRRRQVICRENVGMRALPCNMV